jgi:hypothetical protein
MDEDVAPHKRSDMRAQQTKRRMSLAHSGYACQEPSFSDFPILKSIFPIDGGAIAVRV